MICVFVRHARKRSSSLISVRSVLTACVSLTLVLRLILQLETSLHILLILGFVCWLVASDVISSAIVVHVGIYICVKFCAFVYEILTASHAYNRDSDIIAPTDNDR